MSEKRFKYISRILFVIYIIALIYILLFYAEYRTGELSDEFIRVNLQPFLEMKRGFVKMGEFGVMYFFRNLIGNIVIFAPFGILLPCAFDRCAGLWKTALLGFLTSLMIESCQLIAKVGIFDIDDLILNTSGAVIGYIIYKTLIIKLKKRLCSE